MRVITGSARGRKLVSPAGLDTRPSSDMTKQAVFNIIQNYVEGSNFLDLFAGSGQVGLEALSRGARSATFLDNRPDAIAAIKTNLTNCGLMEKARVSLTDSVSFLEGFAIRSNPVKFDIAFLDPPYQQNLLEKVLPLLSSAMEDTGIIVCETERKEELPESAGEFQLSKTYRYGKAKITVYRKPSPEEE